MDGCWVGGLKDGGWGREFQVFIVEWSIGNGER